MRFLCTIAFAVLLVPLASAQNAAPPPAPCSAPEHRQFDFWLGDWDVSNAAGKQVGRNTITSQHKGCVILENWTGNGGVTGSSLNVYDAARKKWHQTWVDSSGGLLELEGGFADGRMVLVTVPGPRAAVEPVNRITWQQLPDGRVRQLWESSTDGGATWKTAFDGYYSKRS